MEWIEPIIDRTLADVEYARANRANAESLKGARNASDLNRMANNCIILHDLLTSYGYDISPLKQILTPWSMTEFPSTQDIQNILDDVQMLRDKFTAFAEPVTPILPINTYQKMNDIEQVIFDIEMLIGNMVMRFKNCGTFYAGQDESLPLGGNY